MDRFNNNGMMIFPNPDHKDFQQKEKILVVQEAYGPDESNLINSRFKFDKFPGITLKAKNKDGREGMVVISPIFGDGSRMCVDIDLKSGDVMELLTPETNQPLPVFDKCDQCGSELVALYTTKELSLKDCVVICRRVDCPNSKLNSGGEVITQRILEAEDHFSH